MIEILWPLGESIPMRFSLVNLATPISLLVLTASWIAAQTWQPLFVPGSGGRIDAISIQPNSGNSILVGGDIFGVGITRDGGLSWTGDYQGIMNDRIGDFTWHPVDADVVWMGTLGGPHVSTDAGASWTVKRSGMPGISTGVVTAPIEKVLFDPNDAELDRLLAFEGDHRCLDSAEGQHSGTVWISENGGDDWTSEVVIFPDANVTDAEYAGDSGTILFAAVKGQGIFKSIADGTEWFAVNNGLPVGAVALGIETHPTDELIAWALIEDAGVFYTDNGGESWTQSNDGIEPGSNGFNFKSIEVAGFDQQGEAIIYVANAFRGEFGGQFGTGIYRSIDSGESWTHVFSDSNQILNFDAFPDGASVWWLEPDPSNPDVIWAGSSARVTLSTDGGATWIDVLVNDEGAPNLYSGRGFNGWVGTNIEFNPFDHDHIVAQAFDSARTMQSRDGGQTWNRETQSIDDVSPFGGGMDVDFFDENIVFAALGQSAANRPTIVRSSDKGMNWRLLPNPTPDFRVPRSIRVDPDDANRVWVVSLDGLYFSQNANEVDPTNVSWNLVSDFGGGNVFRIESDPNDSNTFYVSARDGVFKTENETDFELLVGGPNNTTNNGGDIRMAIDPVNPGRIYVANFSSFVAAQEGLWRYDPVDGWERIFNDRWTRDISISPLDPNRIALATDKAPYGDILEATGVWLSDDAGDTWENVNDGLPMIRVQSIEYAPDGKNILASLSGRGFYQRAAFIPGDVNRDGAVNLLDIQPFVFLLSANQYLPEADFNCDGVVNLLDINPFIDALGG
jgi:photosystem II stability/assembly factor-like uncharacterized protein